LDITLNLPAEDINAILQILSKMPNESGTFPLLLKIKDQADKFVEANKPVAN